MICENCNNEHDGNYGSGRFCSTKCARGFSTKQKRKEINTAISKKRKQSGHDDVQLNCLNCNKTFIVHWHHRNQKYCSLKCAQNNLKNNPERIKKLKAHAGGYRERGGRGKQGWYKGIYCNSSWELAYVIYCIDNNINIIRNTKGFNYIFQNQRYNFYPDFLIEDKFVEIKGYLDSKNKEKINQFPHKLEVIDKKTIIPYIKYAKTKYGNDYIKLYKSL